MNDLLVLTVPSEKKKKTLIINPS